ncbi:hypothetical protein ACFPM0_25040 [Pseudonocardia sulfidoxydans]
MSITALWLHPGVRTLPYRGGGCRRHDDDRSPIRRSGVRVGML